MGRIKEQLIYEMEIGIRCDRCWELNLGIDRERSALAMLDKDKPLRCQCTGETNVRPDEQIERECTHKAHSANEEYELQKAEGYRSGD
ncbi:MAG: hypothetical protein NVS9B9_10290 [Ktedonobacteraceae bacterium]